MTVKETNKWWWEGCSEGGVRVGLFGAHEEIGLHILPADGRRTSRGWATCVTANRGSGGLRGHVSDTNEGNVRKHIETDGVYRPVSTVSEVWSRR